MKFLGIQWIIYSIQCVVTYLFVYLQFEWSQLFIYSVVFLEPQNWWLNARLWFLHCWETGDTTLLCKDIDVHFSLWSTNICSHFSRTHQLYRVYLCVGLSVDCVDVSSLWIGTTMVTPYWLWLIGQVIRSSKYQNGRYLGITCNLKWVALYWLFQIYTSFVLGISLLVNDLVIL